MELFLIRHGQSANNALPEYQRIEDPPLTNLGWRQAEAVGRWGMEASLSHVLVSPFRRTLETSAPLSQMTGHRPEVWIDLHERGGCFSGYHEKNERGCPGMSGGQIRESFGHVVLGDDINERGWWGSKPRETDGEAVERADRVISRLKATYQGSAARVACVIHADLKRILVARFMGRMPEPGFHPLYHNGSVTALTITDSGETLLVEENGTAHLSDELLSA